LRLQPELCFPGCTLHVHVNLGSSREKK
jgi:hypothetical protein